MIGIRGVYEVAIPVRDLERAERFYTEVLGLEVGLRDATRPWVFMRAGGLGGMIVLQEAPGDWAPMHFAFTVDGADVARAAETLQEKGVPIVGPMRHEWIPATSVYFADPDGHDLELCAAG